MQRSARMKKEIKMLTESPPYGISCWPVDDSLHSLEAQIIGGDETPYSGGIFKLEVQIPERYPFEPPKVRFVTPIYHPNIDTGGRICLDTLKMPPKGAWKPILNISTVLTSIQLLMAEPNPEDPLMTDISNEFRHNRSLYEMNAKVWTAKHAKQQQVSDTMTATTSQKSGDICESSQNEMVILVKGEDQVDSEKSDVDNTVDRKRALPMDNLTNKHQKIS